MDQSKRQLIKKNRLNLTEWLRVDRNLILQHVHSEEIITDGEYRTIKAIGDPDEASSGLLDKLYDKGEDTCAKFIRALNDSRIKETYPDLAKWLASLSAAPAQAPVQAPLTQGPDVLLCSSEQFRSEKLKEGDKIYTPQDKAGRKRLALLINNVKFDYISMRQGAEKDEKRMEVLLNGLGYEVVKHRDLSGKVGIITKKSLKTQLFWQPRELLGMDDAVKQFAQRPEHAESDSTFVVIMSHGKRDAILGVDSKEFRIDDIYSYLNTKGCPGLRNKPKVILIQACRGGEDGSVEMSDGMQDDSMAIESDAHKEHKEKDFISLLSCTPDTLSYRHVKNGTIFVQHLVEEFNTRAHQDHIEELFRGVMKRFETFPSQMVCKERTTLSRLFYLFPGL